MTLYGVREDRIRGLGRAEVRIALRAHNPQVALEEIDDLAAILSLMSDVVTRLPRAEREGMARDQSQLRNVLGEALGRVPIEEAGAVETTRGSGLGAVLDIEEGRNRLDRYVTAMKLEDWAGEVAGAGRIDKLLGIKRSTLSTWYQQGAVVGLLRGQRKLAYPLDQFVDARPLEGLGELLKLAPDARSAWLWARQAHGALEGRTPLQFLHEGRKNQVIAVARRDFT